MVENYSFSTFRNAECISLGDDVISITREYDWAAANATGLNANLVTSLSQFKSHVNRLNTTDETKAIETSDLAFNNAWRAGKYYIKAKQLSPVPEEVEAANKIAALLKANGWNLHLVSYQQQNANAEIMLGDLETKADMVEASATINFTPYAEHIKGAVTNLKNAIEARRNKAISESSPNTSKELRRKLADSLSDVFDYLNIMSKISPRGPFRAMIELINDSIRRIELSITLSSVKNEAEQVDTSLQN